MPKPLKLSLWTLTCCQHQYQNTQQSHARFLKERYSFINIQTLSLHTNVSSTEFRPKCNPRKKCLYRGCGEVSTLWLKFWVSMIGSRAPRSFYLLAEVLSFIFVSVQGSFASVSMLTCKPSMVRPHRTLKMYHVDISIIRGISLSCLGWADLHHCWATRPQKAASIL